MNRALVLAVLVAGCAATVSQLDRMKQNAAAGKRDANATETVACTASQPECYQLHLLRGDACYSLSRTADAAQRREFDACAAEELSAGIAQAPSEQTPDGAIRSYAVKQLEADHDLIDTRRAGDPSGAETLAADATAFRARYPDDPAGAYYLASARLTEAQDQFFNSFDKTQLCTALPPIAALTRQGGTAPGEFAANFTQLSASVAGMRKAGGCA